MARSCMPCAVLDSDGPQASVRGIPTRVVLGATVRSAAPRPSTSRDEYDIVRLQIEILLVGAVRDAVVVERDPNPFVPFLSQHDDTSPCSKLIEAAGEREHVQHRGAALQFVASRF